jgi:hypothetical protein
MRMIIISDAGRGGTILYGAAGGALSIAHKVFAFLPQGVAQLTPKKFSAPPASNPVALLTPQAPPT